MKNFKKKKQKRFSYPFKESDEQFLSCRFWTHLLYMLLWGTIIIIYIFLMIFKYNQYYTLIFFVLQVVLAISYFCVKAKYLAYEDIKYIRDKLYEEEEKEEKTVE